MMFHGGFMVFQGGFIMFQGGFMMFQGGCMMFQGGFMMFQGGFLRVVLGSPVVLCGHGVGVWCGAGLRPGHPLPQLCQPGHAGKCVYLVSLAMQVSVCT